MGEGQGWDEARETSEQTKEKKELHGSLSSTVGRQEYQQDGYPMVFPISHDNCRSKGSGGVHAGTSVIDLRGKGKELQTMLGWSY